MVNVDVIPPSTLKEAKANGKLDMFRAIWISDYPDSEKEPGYHILCAAFKPSKLEYSENTPILGPVVISKESEQNLARFRNRHSPQIQPC